MPSSKKATKNRAPLNLLMGAVGLLAVLLLLLNHLLPLPDAVRLVCGLALIVVIPTLWSTRKSDEYTLQLWTAGANAAFATCLFFFFFLALAQGTADAFPEWEANFIEFTDHAFDLTLLAFFLAFNIKRFTGAL